MEWSEQRGGETCFPCSARSDHISRCLRWAIDQEVAKSRGPGPRPQSHTKVYLSWGHFWSGQVTSGPSAPS